MSLFRTNHENLKVLVEKVGELLELINPLSSCLYLYKNKIQIKISVTNCK